MKLEEAKELFRKHHPEETHFIEDKRINRSEGKTAAAGVWYGFKSALKIMGYLN